MKDFSNNLLGYKILILLSMIYMSIMLCNAVLTNRYVGSDELFILGGTLTSPFIFILDSIISEIYGYKITRTMILFGYAAQTLFVLLCQAAIIMPHPHFFIHNEDYSNILGSSLLRINISGFLAYIIANLSNTYVMTKWKALLKGRYFWLRSIGASSFSAAIYSFCAILMMEMNAIPIRDILKIVAASYLIKISYAFIFCLPAALLVNKIKKITGIDIYDFQPIFTPLKYKRGAEAYD